jgi:hypothetical protein
VAWHAYMISIPWPCILSADVLVLPASVLCIYIDAPTLIGCFVTVVLLGLLLAHKFTQVMGPSRFHCASILVPHMSSHLTAVHSAIIPSCPQMLSLSSLHLTLHASLWAVVPSP